MSYIYSRYNKQDKTIKNNTETTMALIDYSLFNSNKLYKNSISELIDILRTKNLELYALVTEETKKKNVTIDKNISGIITFAQKEVIAGESKFIEKIIRTIRCSNTAKCIAISANTEVLYALEHNGFKTCLVNMGKNDAFTFDSDYEVNDISKVKTLIK